MIETIKWQRELEGKARDLYLLLSQKFSEKRMIRELFEKLAQDEELHYSLMDSALDFLIENNITISAQMIIDNETRQQLEEPFDSVMKKVQNNEINEHEAIVFTIKTELSELNDTFLYILDVMRDKQKSFQQIASVIEKHKNRIYEFIKDNTEYMNDYAKINRMPKIWKHSFLVLDDNEAIRNLICSLLSSMGKVDHGGNGFEGLMKIRENYYDVVVTDIDMPVMTGIQMYHELMKEKKIQKEKIVFITGDLDDEINQLIEQHGITVLEKPFSIFDVKKLVSNLLNE